MFPEELTSDTFPGHSYTRRTGLCWHLLAPVSLPCDVGFQQASDKLRETVSWVFASFNFVSRSTGCLFSSRRCPEHLGNINEHKDKEEKTSSCPYGTYKRRMGFKGVFKGGKPNTSKRLAPNGAANLHFSASNPFPSGKQVPLQLSFLV